MRILALRCAGLVLLLALNNTGITAEATGSVTGTFVLEGAVPDVPPKFIGRPPGARNVIPDETYVVDPESKGLANVFVWISRFTAQRIPPELQRPKIQNVVLKQQNERFVPHCFILRTGQTLTLENLDPMPHNAHTSAVRGAEINVLVKPNNNVRQNITQPDLMPMPVKCDIHPWMVGHVLILDHPYAALSNEKGQFTIDGLPEGTYDFRVWHESQGYVKVDTKDIEVKAGKATDLGTLKVEPK